MFRRNDPRLRRTLNQLSHNLESANESAQAGLFSFSQNYVQPCFDSLGSALRSCTSTCFPNRDERLRRQRGRSRGRPELSFDFYDDWEAEENDALLGWDNDELDRLLAGTAGDGGTSMQPARQVTMNYGTRLDRDSRFAAGRRRTTGPPHAGALDPTIIPNTSYFGFLGRLPWKVGGKGLRYKPSAADLQENPGASRRFDRDEQPLVEGSDEERLPKQKGRHIRNRSGTTASGETTDSLSSRGDLFPSEDEDDAVALDDEFTIALERRGTNMTQDERSSGKSRSSRRRRNSAKTPSSKSSIVSPGKRGTSSLPTPSDESSKEATSFTDLHMDTDPAGEEEDYGVETKHDSAPRPETQLEPQAEDTQSISSEANARGPQNATSLNLIPQMTVSQSPTSPTVSSSGPFSPLPNQRYEAEEAVNDSRERTTPGSPAADNAGSHVTTTDHGPGESMSNDFVAARLPNFTSNPD